MSERDWIVKTENPIIFLFKFLTGWVGFYGLVNMEFKLEPKIEFLTLMDLHPTLKISLFIVLQQTWASRRFLTTLTKFDLELTLGGPQNPNFYPTVKTGWTQCHYKDYQNSHSNDYLWVEIGVKRLRYHENWLTHRLMHL